MSAKTQFMEADAASLDIILSNLNAVAFDLGYYKTGGDAQRKLAMSALAHVEAAEEMLRAERQALALRLANQPKE